MEYLGRDLRGRDLPQTQWRYWMRTSSGIHELGAMQTGVAQAAVMQVAVVRQAGVQWAVVP